jgi:hypothetical protein
MPKMAPQPAATIISTVQYQRIREENGVMEKCLSVKPRIERL